MRLPWRQKSLGSTRVRSGPEPAALYDAYAETIDGNPGVYSTSTLRAALGLPRLSSNDDPLIRAFRYHNAAERLLINAGYYRLPASPDPAGHEPRLWWPPDRHKIAAAAANAPPGPHREQLLHVLLHPDPHTLPY